MSFGIICTFQPAQRIFQRRLFALQRVDERSGRALLGWSVVVNTQPLALPACGAGWLEGVAPDLASATELACANHVAGGVCVCWGIEYLRSGNGIVVRDTVQRGRLQACLGNVGSLGAKSASLEPLFVLPRIDFYCSGFTFKPQLYKNIRPI